MVWSAPDGALKEQVAERQRISVENYRNDPQLLEEHVGMEDNFQAGGYGERQIEELLQNAVDQLSSPGRIEFRLVDGSLYCANEGLPFGPEGIRAVTGAFLSSKRDEKIGRFGLGFKSVLGVSDQPQIYSKSVSFGFNQDEARELLSQLPYKPERLPALRVPSLLDAQSAAIDDPNLEEMFKWAATVVKLPLIRGADRLRKRLQQFDSRYLLFTENLSRIDITLRDGEGKNYTTSYKRSINRGTGLLELTDHNQKTTSWRVLKRKHAISKEVVKSLPGLHKREHVEVSYALQTPIQTENGEFWAWFPLADKTRASGIFNAPWQVNDDRTRMLPNSDLNRELLEVAAELLIDVALQEMTPEDPARHFDALPSTRLDTIQSPADAYISRLIPGLARQRELVPTHDGTYRSPLKVRAPIIQGTRNPFAMPFEAVKAWSEITNAPDTPHWTCYKSPMRAARLQLLLTDESDKPTCTPITPKAWLSESASKRTTAAIESSLTIYGTLRKSGQDLASQFEQALVIPTADGHFSTIKEAKSLLLPVQGAEPPDGLRLVDPTFAFEPQIRLMLQELGVPMVSADQIAQTSAAAFSRDAKDEDWERLWNFISRASRSGGREALDILKERGITAKVPTKDGNWRPAWQAFCNDAQVPSLHNRQVDLPRIGGRSDLLKDAGCLEGMVKNYPTTTEEVFQSYKSGAEDDLEVGLEIADFTDVGPLDVLKELDSAEDSRAERQLAYLTEEAYGMLRPTPVTAVTKPQRAQPRQTYDLGSFALRAIQQYGRVTTTQGPKRPAEAAGPDFVHFSDFIPIVLDLDTLGDDELFDGIPTPALRAFFNREGYQVTKPEAFAELLSLCVNDPKLRPISVIPALHPKTSIVSLVEVQQAVITSNDELDDLLTHGLHYIPSSKWDETLREETGILHAKDAVSRRNIWEFQVDPVPVLDAFHSLPNYVDVELVEVDLSEFLLQKCTSISRLTRSPKGEIELPISSTFEGNTVYVIDELTDEGQLLAISKELDLKLSAEDAEGIVRADEKLRKSQRVLAVQQETGVPRKLLALVGRKALELTLPHGLLEIMEKRQGAQDDDAVADLFLSTFGNDSLLNLKDTINEIGLAAPRQWAGSPDALKFVSNLGFPSTFAGTRQSKASQSEMVLGRVTLKELHPYQKELSDQIRQLVLEPEDPTHANRGLLYLPTGAGKTRVSTQSIAEMLRDDEIDGPVLWIAQSEELCEQAILSWTEVWRAIGDERPLEISRYWGNYETDESLQELQVVVATDAKLLNMIENEANQKFHEWLRNASLVVIDEAHRAGSQSYTRILEWLGITQRGFAKTERPLLGLTATPFRGMNETVNRNFAARFGKRQLNSLDEDDPIGELREMHVLSRVEHQILEGVQVTDAPSSGHQGPSGWDDISKAILRKLGQNLDRTQTLVDHILAQDSEWPILVFTPSVVSAHVTSALLRSANCNADAVDGSMRAQERRRKIESFKDGKTQVLVNCDLLTQGFDAPKVRALYIARPTFSPNRYIQMVGRGLRGPLNGGTDECLLVNMVDTFTQFGDKSLAYTEFNYLWKKKDD